MGNCKSQQKAQGAEVVQASTPSTGAETHRTLQNSECNTKEVYPPEKSAHCQREKQLKCICCFSEHDSSSQTLVCKYNHALCASCAKHFVGSQLVNKVYPMSCSICKAEFEANEVSRLLDENELHKYTEIAISRSLAQNEILFSCQNDLCNASCILALGNCKGNPWGYPSTWIKCFECNVYTCAICQQASTTAVKKHSKECAELAGLKQAFDKAVAAGTAFRCPKCKIRGRKEYGCNHITCAHCQAHWCYVCGKAHDRYRRCKKHIHCASDEKATAALHREQTMRLLRALYRRSDKTMFRKLWERIPSISAHGYSWEEIVGTNFR